ncbi:MAG: arginine deiminase family protein [Acidobacteriota bacterium]
MGSTSQQGDREQVAISVDNEIGHLRRVLVHRPGAEILQMTQHDLERLLFDDILSAPEAAREHDLLVEILQAGGAETLEVLDLLTSALATAPAEATRTLLDRVCALGGAPELAELIADWEPERLARALVEGLHWDDLADAPLSLARVRNRLQGVTRRALRPVPNLMFMRDPCMSVHDHFVVGRMARSARAREPLLVSFALEHGAPIGAEALCFAADDAHLPPSLRSLEGGDLLVLSERTLMVGCSERTTPQTIQRLADESLFAAHPGLETIYVVMMPEERSVMHLDTILTQVDRDLFIGHEPLMVGSRDRPGSPVARLTRDRPPEALSRASVLDVLRDEMGAQTKLVPCGGDEPLHQEREQWTDGANAVCVSPGKIILYSRNRRTIAALAEHGFEEIRMSVVLPADERKELLATGMERDRAVFSFSGSELSRARGGGRCLTMPLAREGVPA